MAGRRFDRTELSDVCVNTFVAVYTGVAFSNKKVFIFDRDAVSVLSRYAWKHQMTRAKYVFWGTEITGAKSTRNQDADVCVYVVVL